MKEINQICYWTSAITMQRATDMQNCKTNCVSMPHSTNVFNSNWNNIAYNK